MTRRLAVALIAAALPALLPSGPTHASLQRPFSSHTLGVRVDVLVTDGRNPVGGLTAADFELRDNGVVQTIDVADSDVPVNAVLALDTSASTAGQRQKDLIAASQALEPIHRMDSPPPNALDRDDPWWRYHLAAGRDADTLLREMWAAVSR
jgi:hypothetical protein